MSKKIFCWVVIAAILTGTTVHATESENLHLLMPDGQLSLEDIQEEPAESVYLGIDTLHIYENMDSSYSQGYIPKVENGTVHLIVPFLASGPLKRDCLTVELDMEENAPFVYANYRKEVKRESFCFEGYTDPVEVYLFRCDIALENDRKNGKYPVTVRAVGYSETGRRAELASRIFITVTDGTDSGPEQTEPPEPGTENPPGQTESPEPGTEKPPVQTDPAGAGTENPPGQTDPTEPDTENPPGQTDPLESETEGLPLIVPDGPGENGGSAGTDEGSGGQNGTQNGETNPGGSGSGEPLTEEPWTEEPLTEEPLTEERETESSLQDNFGSGGGYFGGGYAGGGDIGGSAEKIHRQPKFLLISDSLDGEQLTAGQEYEFTTVFQNMTGDEPVYNMKVTLRIESEAVDFGCSSFYFGKVRPQETVSLPTYLSVKPNAQAGKAVVTFTFEYENDQGSPYTATEEVELDIYQPSQVVMEGFRLASQLYSTDTFDGSFAVHNAGKAAVYNVKVDFAGQGLFSTESVFVGNLEAGASYEGELRVYVGNKTMKSLGDTGSSGKNASDNTEASGDDVDERYGQTSGTLTLTYEDAYGEVYTQTQEFVTEILAPQVVKLSVEKPEEQTNQWQAAILVLTGVIFVLILVFMGWRLRRSKNALADLLAVQRERDL